MSAGVTLSPSTLSAVALGTKPIGVSTASPRPYAQMTAVRGGRSIRALHATCSLSSRNRARPRAVLTGGETNDPSASRSRLARTGVDRTWRAAMIFNEGEHHVH